MRKLLFLCGAWLLVCTLCAFQTEKQSELAQLMRRMIDEATRAKRQAERGAKLGSYPRWFDKLHTATPTDPAVRTAEFAGLGRSFTQQATTAYTTTTKDNYNLMVASCVSCHVKYCPGPLPRIRALQLQ